jgi:dolichyl-phosphate beta-glucosyltransferase
MTTSSPWLTIVIPAYNEELRLAPTLRTVRAFLDAQDFTTEILVVNDGSSDATRPVAEKELEGLGDLGRVLDNPGNKGKGYSVRSGMLEARGEWVLMSDADLSTPIEEVLLLLEQREAHEVIIGSRGMKESQLEERQPLYRETMGRIFNLMVQAIALPGIRDSQCGFKLFRKDAARAVFDKVTIEGFGFDVESLFLARKLGYSIAEVPIRWINDPASKVHAVRDSIRMAADLVKVRVRHTKV